MHCSITAVFNEILIFCSYLDFWLSGYVLKKSCPMCLDKWISTVIFKILKKLTLKNLQSISLYQKLFTKITLSQKKKSFF